MSLSENKNCRPTPYCYHRECECNRHTTFGRFYCQDKHKHFDPQLCRYDLIDMLSVYPRTVRLSLGEFDYDNDLWNKLVKFIGPHLICLSLCIQKSISAEMMTFLFKSTKNVRFLRILINYSSTRFDVPKLESLSYCPRLDEICLICNSFQNTYLTLCLDDLATAVQSSSIGVEVLNKIMPVLVIQQACVGAMFKMQESGVRFDKLKILDKLILNKCESQQYKSLKLSSLRSLTVFSRCHNNLISDYLLKTLSAVQIPAVEQLSVKLNCNLNSESDYCLFWEKKFFNFIGSLQIRTIKFLRIDIKNICGRITYCKKSDKERVINKLIEIRQENPKLDWRFEFLTRHEEVINWECALNSAKILNSKIIFKETQDPIGVSVVWMTQQSIHCFVKFYSIRDLPDDVIIMHVFKFLNAKQLLAAERVNRSFQRCALKALIGRNNVNYMLISKFLPRIRDMPMTCQSSKCASKMATIGEFDNNRLKYLFNSKLKHLLVLNPQLFNFQSPIKCLSIGILNIDENNWQQFVNFVKHLKCLHLIVQDSISSQMMEQLFSAAKNLSSVELIGYLNCSKLESIKYIVKNVEISLIIEISYFKFNLNQLHLLHFFNYSLNSIKVLTKRLPEIILKIPELYSLEQMTLLGVNLIKLRSLHLFDATDIVKYWNSRNINRFYLPNLESLTIDGCDQYSILNKITLIINAPNLKQFKITKKF